jgi:TonB-dependent receptor
MRYLATTSALLAIWATPSFGQTTTVDPVAQGQQRSTTGVQADPIPTARTETGVSQSGSSSTPTTDATTQATTGQSAGAGGTAADDGGIGAQQPGGIGSGQNDDIIVTGYRRSLEDSANAKKNATNFIDSIYSEDVGKFPDLNLAESLQRLPGVQINRDRSGEGTTINVRGLSAGFTVTTINGFATTTSAYSGNEGRGSGLDVIPNELFRRLTLAKSPTANTVEGGTAGVVDLQPLRAFDKKGFQLSLQAQGAYQDANGTFTPRAALIASNTFDTGIGEFGILGAIAWAQRSYRTETFDTVGYTTFAIPQCPQNATALPGCNTGVIATGGYGRGAGATLTTVPGNVPASVGLGAVGTPLSVCANGTPGGTSGLSCQDLSFAIVPRLMRAEQTIGDRSRIGGLINVEYRPNPDLRFRGDFLYSKQNNEFSQHQLMQVIRSYNNTIPVNLAIDEQNIVTSGTFANTYFLNQSDFGDTPSTLSYKSAAMEWDIADNLRFSVSGMLNNSRQTNTAVQLTIQSAPGRIPLTFHPAGTPAPANAPATDLNPVATGQVGYYSYEPGALTPSINSNVDFSTFRNYSWQEGRDGITKQNLDQKAIRFDFVAGDATDFQVSTGFMKNVFDRRIVAYGGGQIAVCFTRGFCGSTFTSTQPSLLQAIPDAQLGNYLKPLPSPLFEGAPFDAGFSNGWLVPDLDKIGSVVDLEYFREGIQPGNTALSYGSSYNRRDLLEDTTSGYLMIDGRKDLFGRELRFNGGIRYASTYQAANGRVNDVILIGGTGVTIREFDTDYSNWLPSANFAYLIRDNLILRGAAAKTVTGVNPADLLPGFSFNLDGDTYDVGNPDLRPFTADNYDVGLEWYGRNRTVLTFNAWWKKLYGYPFVLISQRPFSSLGVNLNALPERTRNGINALGGQNAAINVRQRDNSDLVINLNGYEVQWVQPLDFLLKGLGFNANVTYVKQSLSGERPPNFTANALLGGIAPWTYNLTGYWETRDFQVRVSYVHRDENLTGVGPADNIPGDRYDIATNYLDAQLSFPLPFYRKAAITLQAQNLLQQVQLGRFDQNPQRAFSASYAGRQFVAGLRANF